MPEIQEDSILATGGSDIIIFALHTRGGKDVGCKYLIVIGFGQFMPAKLINSPHLLAVSMRAVLQSSDDSVFARRILVECFRSIDVCVCVMLRVNSSTRG